ncbi:TcpE family conjugal transfer membrane protein [Priestia megaterium]|uniref:TcpE family conjugal transfer membrane protein n=1 Tax=Priestia megaterium TaxID=1404 RepID=UPI002E23CC51|nr:TcpE family conjugal transfer membrane protein [Priestia megaterium]
MKKIDLYTLKEFTKHERKIHGFKNLSFGRPIPLKSVFYFAGALAAMLILRYIPIIGYPIKHLVAVMYLVIPGVITYSLSELETEKRNPLAYARSVILYGIRKLRGRSYYRGKTLERRKTYKFHSTIQGGYLTYKEQNEEENE